MTQKMTTVSPLEIEQEPTNTKRPFHDDPDNSNNDGIMMMNPTISTTDAATTTPAQAHGQPPSTAMLSVVQLTMIVFFNVSGGPFGIEECVRSGGFFFSLLGFLVFPFVWSIPEALITAELGSTYTQDASAGVAWVEEAFGNFGGWQTGYLGWVAGATDNAIYPVLFLDYVLQLTSGTSDGVDDDGSTSSNTSFSRMITLTVVSVVLGYLNWLGLEIVGNISIVIGLFAISPFIVMICIGIFQVDPSRWLQMGIGDTTEDITMMYNNNTTAIDNDGTDSINDLSSMTTTTVTATAATLILWRPYLNNLFWNLNSYDSTASYAQEVENPGKTLPKAMGFAAMLMISAYVLPLAIAIGATDSSPSDWDDGYLASAAGVIGGKWLEDWVILAAGVANISLFQAELSADAYQLMGMADRGFLPPIFSKRSRYGTPTYGLLLGVCVIIAMGNFDLDNLIEMLK
jgi:amino acid transporter